MQFGDSKVALVGGRVVSLPCTPSAIDLAHEPALVDVILSDRPEADESGNDNPARDAPCLSVREGRDDSRCGAPEHVEVETHSHLMALGKARRAPSRGVFAVVAEEVVSARRRGLDEKPSSGNALRSG